ncbi:MAG: hypothetical protein V4640_00245 [Verrucomicrobiota bacterium]
MVFAELPTLQGENRWLGYHVAFENKKCSLGMTTKGAMVLRPLGKGGKSLASKLFVGIDCLLIETMPDGKEVMLKQIVSSMESEGGATRDPQDLIFRGKVKGGATFELNLDEDRGKIFLGGRVVDTGSSKNPLRFAIRLTLPNAYPSEKKGFDKEHQRAFEKKTEDDHLLLDGLNGKRGKLATTDPIDAASIDVNVREIRSAQLEFSSWKERKLKAVATESSALTLELADGMPLWKGFSLVWSATPTQDPQGKARLEIEMR